MQQISSQCTYPATSSALGSDCKGLSSAPSQSSTPNHQKRKTGVGGAYAVHFV
ncbi:hypothetical protein HanRHA438_Chr14g0650681 [Helianthus annuus]|nr:hypothetical protein HanRHA438_Chr14g0650681 [Helianthus annuus]